MVFFQFQEVIVLRLRIAFLMTAAVIAAVELAGPAAAQTIAHKSTDTHVLGTHVLVVHLPDGSIERIRYAGNRRPRVSIDGGPDPAPGLFDPFWPSAPFSDLDRISAAMDREAAAMLQQADSMMQTPPGDLTTVDLNGLPAGVQGYSMVSTISGNSVCTRSARYFSTGDGKPRVESSTSGNCAPGKASAPVPTKAARPAFKPKTSGIIEVNAQPPSQAKLRLASAVN
jgi:hypothetical protein